MIKVCSGVLVEHKLSELFVAVTTKPGNGFYSPATSSRRLSRYVLIRFSFVLFTFTVRPRKSWFRRPWFRRIVGPTFPHEVSSGGALSSFV